MSWQPLEVDYDGAPIFLFDGVCNLCSTSVRYIIKHDTANAFLFVPIQSEAGRVFANRFGISVETPETAVIIMDGMAYFKSDLPLTFLRAVNKWPIAQAGRIIPRPVRNWLYDRVANNRYAIFGRTEECMVPTAELTARFITDPAHLRL